MTTEPFIRPRLTGRRFEGHSIPLEFLNDLAVLEVMIVEVAKAKFLEDHPGRKRSPRGFIDGIEFRLTEIGDGSAVLEIGLAVASTALFPQANQQYIERARDAVVDAIWAAGNNEPITKYLPEHTLSYFDKFGRSLRDGEAIEFTRLGGDGVASLTKDTRRKLLLASTSVRELTDDTLIRGSVPEADQEKMSFEVQLNDGRRIKAPIIPQHLDTIKEAFSGYKTGTRLMIQGVGRFNRSGRLQSFDAVEHVSILDPLDISARLDDLRLLNDGWFEGEGVAPSGGGLDWLSDAAQRYYSDELPLPYIYPTPEGDIRFEWRLGSVESSLDILLGTHEAYWHQLDLDTGSDDEDELNLDMEADWIWLNYRIQSLTGDAV